MSFACRYGTLFKELLFSELLGLELLNEKEHNKSAQASHKLNFSVSEQSANALQEGCTWRDSYKSAPPN